MESEASEEPSGQAHDEEWWPHSREWSAPFVGDGPALIEVLELGAHAAGHDRWTLSIKLDFSDEHSEDYDSWEESEQDRELFGRPRDMSFYLDVKDFQLALEVHYDRVTVEVQARGNESQQVLRAMAAMRNALSRQPFTALLLSLQKTPPKQQPKSEQELDPPKPDEAIIFPRETLVLESQEQEQPADAMIIAEPSTAEPQPERVRKKPELSFMRWSKDHKEELGVIGVLLGIAAGLVKLLGG